MMFLDILDHLASHFGGRGRGEIRQNKFQISDFELFSRHRCYNVHLKGLSSIFLDESKFNITFSYSHNADHSQCSRHNTTLPTYQKASQTQSPRHSQRYQTHELSTINQEIYLKRHIFETPQQNQTPRYLQVHLVSTITFYDLVQTVFFFSQCNLLFTLSFGFPMYSVHIYSTNNATHSIFQSLLHVPLRFLDSCFLIFQSQFRSETKQQYPQKCRSTCSVKPKLESIQWKQ